jgi:hypothetical protein
VLRLSLFLLLLGCLGCAYRLVQPRSLDDGLRIEFITAHTRLPAIEQELRRALAAAIARDLGWPVRSDGAALLRIRLPGEEIEAGGHDERGITDRWLLTLPCEVEFTGLGQQRQSRLQASASYRSLDNEGAGLRAAADSLATRISHWLSLIATDKPGE